MAQPVTTYSNGVIQNSSVLGNWFLYEERKVVAAPYASDPSPFPLSKLYKAHDKKTIMILTDRV